MQRLHASCTGPLFALISAALFGCTDKAADSPSALTQASATASIATSGPTASATATASEAAAGSASNAELPPSASGASASASAVTSIEPAASSATSSAAGPSPSHTALPRPTGKVPPRPRPTKGRPFVIEDAARTAGPTRREDWTQLSELPDAPAADRAHIAAHYVEMALAEHASVASFAKLGLELLAVGAPAALLTDCARAMEDEIRHAQIAFGVASALGTEAVGPAAFELALTNLAQPSLAALVRSTVREGILGETLAALELKVAAVGAHPLLREQLERIADDEARHAKLAFAFVAWALRQDAGVASVVREELAAWSAPSLDQAHPNQDWGMLATHTAQSVYAEGVRDVVTPLLERLLAASEQV